MDTGNSFVVTGTWTRLVGTLVSRTDIREGSPDPVPVHPAQVGADAGAGTAPGVAADTGDP
ncbi:hypothetical protein [Desertihabitans brevis]|uniref:hypothetical protein n=1 Tax=Desertihabitans brevis TaxID=2268447 RepID=UPI000DEDB3E8|nr:hypothetical protein [Desertihabitans brevis]